MVYFKDMYIVIGGTSDSHVTETCESWDTITQWKEFPKMVKAWKNPAAVVFDSSIYVFAGSNQGKVIMNTIEKFNGSHWELIDIRLPL